MSHSNFDKAGAVLELMRLGRSQEKKSVSNMVRELIRVGVSSKELLRFFSSFLPEQEEKICTPDGCRRMVILYDWKFLTSVLWELEKRNL